MASIQKLPNGVKITVFCGIGLDGRQIRRCTTYKPDPRLRGSALDAAIDAYAARFEQLVKSDPAADVNVSLGVFGQRVIADKAANGAITITTEDRYNDMFARISAEIGKMRVVDVKPSNIRKLLDNLREGNNGTYARGVVSTDDYRAAANRRTQSALSADARVAPKTVARAAEGLPVRRDCADKLAAAVGLSFDAAFLPVTVSKRPLAQKTVLEHYHLLHMIFAQAVIEDLITSNPTDKVVKPSARPVKTVECLAVDELRAIIAALEGESLLWQCILRLMIELGERRGAIVGLLDRAVNTADCTAQIMTTIVSIGGQAVQKANPKTKNSERTAYFSAETARKIDDWRAERDSIKDAVGDLWTDTGYLFVGEYGKPLHPDSVTKWLGKFAARHGFRHLHPHMFRHAYTTLLVANGLPITTVAAAVGDKQQTIIDRYIHSDKKYAGKLANDLISNLLYEPNKK